MFLGIQTHMREEIGRVRSGAVHATNRDIEPDWKTGKVLRGTRATHIHDLIELEPQCIKLFLRRRNRGSASRKIIPEIGKGVLIESSR